MFLCDYHTHSCFSFDGAAHSSPDALCCAAIDKGITHLALTDHFEANCLSEGAYEPYDADRAYEEMLIVKEKYKDKLSLAIGIELGQGYQFPEETKKLLSSHKYDFIIGSIHNLWGAPDFYFMDFSKIPQAYSTHLFSRYLDEMNEMLDAGYRIDTVGHFTYMHRYIAIAGGKFDFTPFYGRLSELFGKIVSKDIALEVNVSTVRKGLGFAMPDREILGLYRDCGGRLVTVGSDAHRPEDVGECVPYAFELLRDLGFDSVTVVENGEKCTKKIN